MDSMVRIFQSKAQLCKYNSFNIRENSNNSYLNDGTVDIYQELSDKIPEFL